MHNLEGEIITIIWLKIRGFVFEINIKHFYHVNNFYFKDNWDNYLS